MTGDASARTPVPEGTVSRIRGRYQGPGLSWLTRIVMVAGVLGWLLPGAVGIAVATGAVVAIIAAPLLRVGWLVLRWTQERDRHFQLLGAALLAVVATGAALSAAGVGS